MVSGGFRMRWLLFFCFMISSDNIFSQPSRLPDKNIIFDHFPDQLGLGQNTINCMIQDSEGFLWIGTWSGLIRYDGYSAVIYHSDNAPGKLKSNKITAIHEDHSGFIWVGTQVGGLFRYDKAADLFTQFIHHNDSSESISNNSIWAIQEDRKHNLWIGTENGLNLYNYKRNSFQSFHYNANIQSSLSQSFITDLFLSSIGELWIGTENGLNRLVPDAKGGYAFERIIYYENGVPSTRTSPDHYFHNFIFKIDELRTDSTSSIWFSTIKGLKKLEHNNVTNFEIDNRSASFSYFRSLHVVNDATRPFILVGSEMGLNFFDPKTMQFTKFLGDYDKTVNLSHNTVTTLFVDRGGVLWVGTKKGLNKYDSYSKDFELHKTSSFDNTNSIITGICQAEKDGYWISTIGGGLFRFNGSSFTRHKIPGRSTSDFVDFIQTLYKDSNGNVWIGTAGSGVLVFNEKDISKQSYTVKKFSSSESENTIDDSHIMSFFEDATHNMWIGMWSGGLNRIDATGKIVKYNASILKRAPIVALYADHSGALWIGTRGNGLYRLVENDGKTDIKQYAHDDQNKKSLVDNFINAIYEDHAGTLWIGTEGGLVSFDRRTELFDLKNIEGGPTNNVVSMLEDDAGKLWLAHWDGVSKFDPANPVSMINYDEHDRIQGGFFYNNVCLKTTRGLLLFGGSNGFNIIDPRSIKQNSVKPALVISDFQIFNKPVSYGVLFNGRVVIDKPLSKMNNIVLKHHENSVSFEFAALDYAAPEKIRYAYRLEGFDKNWNYTNSSRRYANYTNLEPGDYSLVVRATNTEGEWDSATTHVSFTINPPWWKTIWAILIYCFLSIVALYFFRRLVLMRVNFMHALKVERMQRDNLEKLNKAKLQFFTNVSHEFRTPLTLILGPAQNLLDAPEGKIARDQILSINDNAQRLLRLVNQLLDFRKTESGNLQLEVAEGNIVKFIKEIKLSFEPLAEQMKINFSFVSSSNVINAWFDRDQFEKIMFNLLSNAFKNTPEGGMISIQIKEEKQHLVICVEDNGRGIKPEHFENIFQSFFSYDEDRHHTGTGIGLALTKSLVVMHHGSVFVESKENQFTRFVVTIPLGNTHFDASELAPDVKNADDLEIYQAVTDGKKNTEPVPGKRVFDNLDELPKILIVEDNADVRSYLKSIFLDSYCVLEAEEGKEALDIAAEEMPDIVISDVMMPIMDGITLCKQLKSSVKTSHIPVILLTARTSLIFKVEGLETGADDYMTKPFNPKVLELKVRNILRTRELLRKSFKDNGVLHIEPSHVTLTSADETFVKRALESIENNMSDTEYSIEVLGKDVGMSRMQLYRKLKAITGQSANEFIRTIRLKRAAQLLEQKQLTIAEVTYEVGFNDLQYFRECFKKMFLVTPSEYVQRKSNSESIE